MKRKNKIAHKKATKKIPEIQENKVNNITGATGRRLTLLQKKVISNLEKGYNTSDEIAKNLNVPVGIIENELKIFLPVSYQALLKDFKERLQKEIEIHIS